MPEALFVGREREIDLYKQFLARKTPWVLIITGLGGIGKTTLLYRLTEYTLAEPALSETRVVTLDFADEELRIDPLKLLDKLTKDTAPYCDVQQLDAELKNELHQNSGQLAQLSKERIQTGVSEAEDPALREMRHQMRQLATEAFYVQIKTFTLDRLVIMLDTCEWLNEPEGVDVGQWVLNELVPGIHTRIRQKGRQCSVVMASRVQPRLDAINGQDQRRITISMLGKAEVDQYLEHMGMNDSSLRQRVYEVTHGHALCISIIGDYWQNRGEQSHPFTIADLPELELQEISEIALIRFTNERVLRHLRTPFKELTRYGVLLRSFDLPLLKNVFPELLPEPAALERFNRLIRYPYIESRGNYRYAFHELVHEALTEETQKEEPEAWKRYHKLALDYFTAVSPRPPDWYYHLLAYDEKQGLAEWQQAIQEARESGKREYIGALLQAALDKALKLSLAARAEVVYEQGRFNYYGVQWEEALKSYKEALTAFQEMGDDSGQAKVLHCIGDVQRVLARQDDALESYAQALAFFRQAGDQLGEAKCCQAMGDVWRLRNDQDAALQSYEQALNLFRQIANQPEEAKVLEALGDVQRLRNEQDAALRSYEQALALYQEEKDRLKRAKLLKAIGDVQRLQQDKDAALESYAQALALFGELKEPAEEANVRRAIEEMQQSQAVKHAESTYASLPSDEHRRLARALFLRLIDPGTTEQETTRRRASLAELVLPDPQQTRIIHEVADAFTAARLLTTNEIAGTTTIEVSHEALIREWVRLAEWLHEAREDIAIQRTISTDAAEWVLRGKPTDRLYRGTQLIEAQVWAERNVANADEEAFLQAGANEQARQETLIAVHQQQEALQRKRYTRRTVLAGLVGLGLTAAAVGSFLFVRGESAPAGGISPFQMEPSNLGFSEGLKYWFLAGDTPQDYAYGIDPTLTLNGKASAYLKARVAQPAGFGTLMQQFFPGKEYLGKRVRMSGYVKAEGVEQWAGLWMRVDGPNSSTLSFDNMQNRPIKGTSDWKKYEIVLDVPQESIGIYFGILLGGKGQVWLSEVQFQVVGKEVPTTSGTPELPKEAHNLDFAADTQSWFLAGSNPQDYAYGIDPTLTLNGKASAYLKARVAQPAGFGTLMQAFQGKEYLGKRVRMSGYVKAEGVEQWAGLWMRVDGPNSSTLSFDNMQNRPIKGTSDWKKYEIVLDVPQESIGIYFGILLGGKGQVWLSEVQFQVVGKEVPMTGG